MSENVEEQPIKPDPMVPVSDPNAQPVEILPPPAPSEFSKRVVIVVPLLKKTQGEALARSMDKNTKGNTFTVELSPTGTLPVTHYWCSWAVTPAMAGIAKAGPNAANAQIFDMEEYTPEQILSQLGLKRIVNDSLV